MLDTHGITPFILVPDLEEAVAFYEGLGFACTFRGEEDGYAYMRTEGGGLRLLEQPAIASQEGLRHMVYVDVPDVDAFWGQTRGFLKDLPEGRVRPPFDQEYGQREVHVIDPGGTLLFFGQAVG
ncbi:MAG: VOC family protein [Pseudomonadota bacterium]